MRSLRRSLIVVLTAVAAVVAGTSLRQFVDNLNSPSAAPLAPSESPSQAPSP